MEHYLLRHLYDVRLPLSIDKPSYAIQRRVWVAVDHDLAIEVLSLFRSCHYRTWNKVSSAQYAASVIARSAGVSSPVTSQSPEQKIQKLSRPYRVVGMETWMSVQSEEVSQLDSQSRPACHEFRDALCEPVSANPIL